MRDQAPLHAKVDLKKEVDAYRATTTFRLLDVPPMQYLMVDGRGDPNTSMAYDEALRALYPLAHALRFASKRELDLVSQDMVIAQLEKAEVLAKVGLGRTA